jgi:hypothetical protein
MSLLLDYNGPNGTRQISPSKDGAPRGKGMPDEVRGQLSLESPGPLSKQIRLLDASAAALNQDDQHDDKKHPGHNPDNRGLIHFDSLPSLMVADLVSEKRFE